MELVSQIAAIESPRDIMKAAQARLMAKTMSNPEAIGDLMAKEVWEEGGQIVEEGRRFDDFGDPAYLLRDGFISIASVVANRVSRVMEEGGEYLSFGGRVKKVEVEKVNLEPNGISDKMY